MKKGFFIIQRDLRDQAQAISPKVKVLMMEIVALANYAPTSVRHGGKMIELKPGQLVASRDYLAAQTGYSVSEVRTALKLAADSHLIRTSIARDGIVITICNYEEMQCNGSSAATPDSHLISSKIAILETINNKQEDNTCAFDEGKKKKAKSSSVVDPKFDLNAIYELYPRKRGKEAGMKKLAGLIKTQSDYDLLKLCTENYVKEILEDQTEKKYIKLFSTFANNFKDYEIYESKGRAVETSTAGLNKF